MWGNRRPIPVDSPMYKSTQKPPLKKQFKTMKKMIKDAAKYDICNEQNVSNAILKDLIEYIGNYLIQTEPKKSE